MTNEQRLEFEAQGYLVLDTRADALEGLQTAFDRALQQDLLNDLPNQDDAFIYLAEHPDFFPTVYYILSDDLQLRSTNGLYLPPHSPGRGWQRQVAGLLGVHHPTSTLCLQVFFHLDDCLKDDALLTVVPGSQRFKSELQFPEITHIEDMPHSVTLPAKAGTAVIVHGNLWQARRGNCSNAPRRLVELTYIHCWMRQALPALSPAARDIVRASHNLSQLFGLTDDIDRASNYWHLRIEGYPASTGLPERRFSPLKVVGKGTAPNT
jgi:hypothetical protein